MTGTERVEGTIHRLSYRTRGSELVVHAVGRSTDGSKIDTEIMGTRPFFYVDAREADIIPAVQQIVGQEPGPPSTDGRSTIKVYTRFPFDVRDARQRFTWSGEGDVVYPVRLRIDHRLVHVSLPAKPSFHVSEVQALKERPAAAPWTMMLDIETDDSQGFPRPEAPTAPVTSVSWWDDHHRKYGVAFIGAPIDEAEVRKHLPRAIDEPVRLFPRKNETDLFWGFGQVLRQMDPDAVTSWNGYRYDYPYLAGRAERLLARHGGDPDVQRVQDTFYCTQNEHRSTETAEWSFNQNHGRATLIDSLAAYRKNQMRQMSFSLEAVAQELFGFGKVERPPKVSDLQQEDPAKWVAYNLWDTHLVRLIEDRKKLVPLILRWAQLAMVETTDTTMNQRIVDGILFQTARKSGTSRIVLPTSRSTSKTEKSKGPAVFDPVVGAFVHAVVFDQKQCYPALIATFGISPDALCEPTDPGVVTQLPSGGCYRDGGILAEASIDLMKFRDEAKKYAASLKKGTPEREDADTTAATLRHVINSEAGVQTAPHWRMSNRTVFEDITGMSRVQLLFIRDHMEYPPWLKEVTGRDLQGRVLFGDTDSVCAYFTENGQPLDFDTAKEVAWKIRDELNRLYPAWAAQFGAKRNYTEIGVDGILGHLHTLPLVGTTDEGAKKRYYGDYVLEKDQDVREVPLEKRMKIAGVEYRRFNNAPATREVQLGVMTRFCEGRSVEEIRDWVQTRIADVPDEDLWCACKMGKATFDDYESKQPFVRAMMALHAVTGREVRREDEFRWAYVTSVHYHGIDVTDQIRRDGRDQPLFAVPLHLSDAEVRKLGLTIVIDRMELEQDHWLEEAEKVLPELAERMPSMADSF